MTTYWIEVEVIRNHPNTPGVIEISSPLIGRHWVYANEFYDTARELLLKSVGAQHEKMTKAEFD